MSEVEERIAAGAPVFALTADVVRGRMRAALFGTGAEAPSSERYTILERLGEGGMGTVWAAWDSKLDRKVALKLLRPELVDDPAAAHRRLLREAQALARVADPHVVGVFDVTSWAPPDAPDREHVLLAMELIAGETLASWLERPRPLSEVIGKLVDAARGLMAAHGAGVIHGDFKPANVIVGADGRARVVDFGLARIADRHTHDELHHAGTPLYMAPEQHDGQPIDSAADQYALCVTLWEAVAGAPPFSAPTIGALVLAKLAFESRRAPPGMPGWLHRTLVRGLAPRPADRHPSLAAVVAALQRGLSPRWRTPAAFATVAGAVAVALWAQDRDPCDGGDARLAEVWNESRRDAAAAAFARSGLGYATVTWENTASTLDVWSTAWVGAWRDACETHGIGAQSDDLLDLRMTCLEQRVEHLDALVGLFVAGEPDAIEHAVQAASRLPGIERCSDAIALRLVVPMPDDREQRAEIGALGRKLATARVELDAGRHDIAARAALEVVDAARAQPVEHLPLVADALYVRADALGWRGAYEDAMTQWRESALTAERAGDDDLFVRASAGLVWEMANSGVRFDAAHVWAAMAGATASRIGDAPHAEYLLRNAEGTLAMFEQDYDAARDHFTRGLEIVERVWGPEDFRSLTLHTNLGNLELRAEGVDAALEHFRTAFDVGAATLGPEHPRVLVCRYDLAVALISAGLSADATVELETLVAAQLAIGGSDHPGLGWSYTSLAMAETNLERAAAARDHASRALELLDETPALAYARVVARLARARAALALDDIDAARADADLALTQLHAGSFTPGDESEALAIVAEIAMARPEGRDVEPELRAAWKAAVASGNHDSIGAALMRFAVLERSRSRPELAIWWTVASVLELSGRPAPSRRLAGAHVMMAEILLDLGRLDEAEAQLERTIAVLEGEAILPEWISDRVLAQARLDLLRGERARARVRIVAHRDRLDEASTDRAAFDAWLAAH